MSNRYLDKDAYIIWNDYKDQFFAMDFIKEWDPNIEYPVNSLVWNGTETTQSFFLKYKDNATDPKVPVTDKEYWKSVDKKEAYEFGNVLAYTLFLNPLEEARSVFLESLIGTNVEKIASLYLIAFWVYYDRASYNNQYSPNSLVASSSVGDVSISYQYPQNKINSYTRELYNQNSFGQKYLALINQNISTPGAKLFKGRISNRI